MSNIAIQFDHVGKLYHLGVVGTGTLSHDLNRWWKMSVLGKEDPYLKIGETNDRSKKGSSDFVWALKDITFDVNGVKVRYLSSDVLDGPPVCTEDLNGLTYVKKPRKNNSSIN